MKRVGSGTEAAVAAVYDALADTYEAGYQTPKDLAENAVLAERLRRRGIETGTVLDVGCGTGLVVDLLDVYRGDYLGVDLSDGMLRVAEAKYPTFVFVPGDFAGPDVPIPGFGPRFDHVVSLFGPFSYVTAPCTAVAGLHRCLRRSGDFFVCAYGLPHERRHYLPGAPALPPRTLYDPATLRRLFSREAGFRDVRVWSFALTTRWMPARCPAWLARLWVRADMALGHLFPGAGVFIVVEGRREP